MNNDQITALAREYAEEMHYGDNYFENENKRFLTWLTRRYCLVEKEKVVELYQTNRQRELTQRLPISTAVVLALESLFPDLGKEVEP